MLQVAYSGRAHKEPLDFLEKLGFKCDDMYNPADFFRKIRFPFLYKVIILPFILILPCAIQSRSCKTSQSFFHVDTFHMSETKINR